MFGLITMLLSTLGATGMGSMLKIVAGIVDRVGAAKESREKRELIREMQLREADIKFQESVFGGTDESSIYTRSTRRVIALIGMLNFATVSILCTIYPSVELVTFIPPAHLTEFNLFWGFIKFPINQGATVAITTGHIALTSITILGAIIGFYFTPAGRK
jgi:hypothetical protein|tara:strand:- start:1082 stop:1561 length:480 start_codon:yes stop_codon:yes gene_type:complete